MPMRKNQRIRPDRGHLPVEPLKEYTRIEGFRRTVEEPVFANVASGPFVRSPCHADHQATDTA